MIEFEARIRYAYPRGGDQTPIYLRQQSRSHVRREPLQVWLAWGPGRR
jgi:hypothetical protein